MLDDRTNEDMQDVYDPLTRWDIDCPRCEGCRGYDEGDMWHACEGCGGTGVLSFDDEEDFDEPDNDPPSYEGGWGWAVR